MQAIVSVEKISERFLLPALEQLFDAFPFVILGFHADNGSEYINHHVARLLEKLRIELTKSRARQSNDNALVESKNGSIVRKHLGYSHIPSRFAQRVNTFSVHVLTPYLNYHRPCLFAEEIVDARGKRKKRYPYALMMTPYDKLKSLPHAEQYLKPDILASITPALCSPSAVSCATSRIDLFVIVYHLDQFSQPTAMVRATSV